MGVEDLLGDGPSNLSCTRHRCSVCPRSVCSAPRSACRIRGSPEGLPQPGRPCYMLSQESHVITKPLEITQLIMHSLLSSSVFWQALLGAGAIILALIFVITSFGGDGPSSSRRSGPTQQVCPSALHAQQYGLQDWHRTAII